MTPEDIKRLRAIEVAAGGISRDYGTNASYDRRQVRRLAGMVSELARIIHNETCTQEGCEGV